MRIIHVISQFRPIQGGAERQCELQARELARRGHEVVVLTGHWRRDTPIHETLPPLEPPSIEIPGDSATHAPRQFAPPRRVLVRRHPMFYGGNGVRGVARLGRWRYMTTLAAELWKRREWADVIHVHQLAAGAIVSGYARRRLNIPTLVRIACAGFGSDVHMLQAGANGVEEKFLWPLTLANDRFVSLTNEIARELMGAGYPEPRVREIPNGVWIPAEIAPRERFRGHLAWVGSFREQKNLPTLLKALRLVRSSGDSRFRVRLFGDGPERAKLAAMVAELDLGDAVEFAGRVPHVTEHLREWADVFVLPSFGEGMSNALLEALALGIPAIVSDIPTHRDIFAGTAAGWKFAVDSPDALASCLARIGEDDATWKAASAAARELAIGRYSIQRVVDAYENLYGEMRAVANRRPMRR